MSHGCGTLGSPGSSGTILRKSNAAAASSNGKQHTLPKHPRHRLTDGEAVEAHWGIDQPKGPTRLWGTTKATRIGGVEREEGSELWLKGEYWNCDSNICIWGPHEVKRNAAQQNHDVHRHDQIARVVLPPHPGTRNGRAQVPKQCMSGVVSADSCFLEAWGFDLGLRDRQANPTGLWKPVNSSQMFRAERSYNRDTKRLLENFRTMRKTASVPGTTMPANVVTLRPEDVGGEAGDAASSEDHMLDRMGRTHGSRSCTFHDTYDHASKREAAKMACAIHSPSFKSHPHAYPIKEHLELNPASVYTRKFKQSGEDALRKHITPSEKMGRTTTGSSRTKLMSTL